VKQTIIHPVSIYSGAYRLWPDDARHNIPTNTESQS
jgi:hypothetical protein